MPELNEIAYARVEAGAVAAERVRAETTQRASNPARALRSTLLTGLLTIVVTTACATASSASAATVRVEGDTLIYEAAPGDIDSGGLFTVGSGPGDRRWYFNGAHVVPGEGCVHGLRARRPAVTCDIVPNATFDLGDGDDDVVVRGAATQLLDVRIVGGDGNDALRVRPDPSRLVNVALAGGGGDDELEASSRGALLLDGGSGDDRLAAARGSLVGGDGNDRLTGFGPVTYDAGAGNDEVLSRASGDGAPGALRPIQLGSGNDRFAGVGGDARHRQDVRGGAGNDSFASEYGCICAFFGEAGSDRFNTVSRLYLMPRSRSQLVHGGRGRDRADLDGTDCARSLEQVRLRKQARDDARYRCRLRGSRPR